MPKQCASYTSKSWTICSIRTVS